MWLVRFGGRRRGATMHACPEMGKQWTTFLITWITLVYQTWGKGGCQGGRGWLVHNRKQIANVVFVRGLRYFPQP